NQLYIFNQHRLRLEGILLPPHRQCFNVVCHTMRQYLTFILILTLFVSANGQSANILTIKMKSDSVLKAFIGDNYIELQPKLSEIRTTDKYGVYHYFEFTGKKGFIPVSKE